MANVATLTARLEADTSGLKRGLNSAEREVKGFGSRTGALLKGVGVAAVAGVAVAGAAIAGVAVKGVMAFADFEKGMNEVFTLLPGMSQAAMDKMSGQVLDLSNTMGVLPEQAIPALYQALSAGVPTDNVFAFMESANKLAIGGVAELDASVSALTGVMNAYTDGSVTAEQAADMMFTTVKNGVTTIPELAASLGEVTPIAAALGVGFDEVSAAMAASTKITQNTSKSAVGLKNMLAELGKGGTIASTAFEKIAGETFPDFIASGGDLSGALKLMQAGADASGETMLDLFGSIEAGQEALRLAAGGAAELDAQLANMGSGAGAAQAAFDQMDQGLSRSWDKIKTTMTTTLIKVGAKLAPFVESAAVWLSEKLPDAIDWLVRTFEDMKPAFDMVAHWLGEMIPRAIGLLTKALDGVGELFDNVWGSIGPGVTEAVEAINSTLGEIRWENIGADLERAAADLKAGWDSVWRSLGVSWDDFTSTLAMFWEDFWGGLVDGAVDGWAAIAKWWDMVSGGFSRLWRRFGDNLTSWWRGLWDGISQIFGGWNTTMLGLWDVFAGLFTLDFGRMWKGITELFSGWNQTLLGLASVVWANLKLMWGLLWEGVTVVFGDAWNGIIGILQERWAAFTGILGTVWNIFSGWWTTNWNNLTGVVSTVWGLIYDSVAPGLGLVRDAMALIWASISGTVGRVWGGIVSTIEGFVNTIIDLVNKAIAAFNSLPGVPDIAGIPSVGRTSGGGVRRLAAGGIVTSPTLALVGEAGPEAVIPLSGNRGGMGMVINIHGNLFGAATVDELADVLTTAQVGQTRRGW